MDIITKEKRSWVMSRVKSQNTKPELIVRSTLHRMGYRFRLYRNDLPGKPDIVLPKYHAVIFVHGCFWHRHTCKNGIRLPASHQEYWVQKFHANLNRDKVSQTLLENQGWHVLIIWECEVKSGIFYAKIEEFFYRIKLGIPTKA